MNNNRTSVKTSMKVDIENGQGTIKFPSSLRYNLYETFVSCHSVRSFDNFDNVYYLTCNASYYKQFDDTFCPNVLQSFNSSSTIFHFPTSLELSLNFIPESITFYAQRMVDGKLVTDNSFNGQLIIQLRGKRSIKGNN